MTRLRWIDTTREESWLPGLRAVNLLLRAGQPVCFAPRAGPGAPYLALSDPNQAVERWLLEQGITLKAGDAIGDELIPLRPARVALFGGAGSPYCHASAFAALGLSWCFVTGADIRSGALDRADLIVMPGGGWRFGDGLLDDLGEPGGAAVLRFIEAGGGYLSSCAGSMIAMHQPDTTNPLKSVFTPLAVENWERLRDSDGGNRSPGIGVVKARLAEPRHPVGFGLPDEIEVAHYNGPIFVDPSGVADAVLRFAGVTSDFTPSEHFHDGARDLTEHDLAASDMVEAGDMGLPAIVAGGRGAGRIVMAGVHPEFGLNPGLASWGRPVHLIGNAVLWLGRLGRGAGAPPPVTPGDLDAASRAITHAIERARAAVWRLQQLDDRADSVWLDRPEPRAAFGRTPVELWRATLDDLPHRIDHIRAAWREARSVAEGEQRDRLAAVALDRFEPDGGPDLGGQGVIWLLEEATRLIDDASDALEMDDPATRTRAELRVSRSYLSAGGLLTNAEQRIRAETDTYAAEHDLARLRGMVSQAPAPAGR